MRPYLQNSEPLQFWFRVHVCQIPAAAASRGRRRCQGTSGRSVCWDDSDPWASVTSCFSSSASSQPWPIYTMRRSSRKETRSLRASSSRTVNCKGDESEVTRLLAAWKSSKLILVLACVFFFFFVQICLWRRVQQSDPRTEQRGSRPHHALRPPSWTQRVFPGPRAGHW